MKKLRGISYFFIFALFLGLSACSDSKSDSNPDLGATVAGTYQMQSMKAGSQEITPALLALAGGKLDIVLTRKDAKSATFLLKLTLAGQTAVDQNSSIDLTDGGSGTINISEAGQSIGTYKSGTLSLKGKDSSGDSYELVAKK
jgi:hypothetical protein